MNTFSKSERLKSKKIIEQLFEKGKSADAPPLKFIWMPVALRPEYPVQAGFTVSKRNFQKSVDRNRIKRLMREAWRLQKAQLFSFLSEKNIQLAAMMIYTGKKKPEFMEVMEKMAAVIRKLKKSM